MAVEAFRQLVIVFTGAVTGTETVNAANNANSPGEIEIRTLASGANTITVPTSGTVATAVTLIPPVGNVNLITLKGVAGDTGVALHLTDPTTIALGAAVTTFVLNAAATVTGIRLIWS